MRKLLYLLIAAALCVPVGAQAWWKSIQQVAVGGPTATTWNPADVSTNVALSGGNLTATRVPGFDGNNYGVRANAGHSSGKFFYSVVDGVDNTNNIGIANAAASISLNVGGSDTNGLGYVSSSGNIIINNVGVGNGGTYTTGDVVDLAVDLTAKRIWVRVNNGIWNSDASADPVAGTGGFDISTLAAGPYFPAAWFLVGSAAFTANFGATAYTFAAPSGYANF